MGAEYPNFADVTGARALLFLARSSPAPPTPPALSDELSCSSGSSSSYSGASARSCVSDTARRGRPVDPLRVLSVVASLRRINPKMLAEATGALFHSGAEKKRKGVWIEVDSYEDQSERSSAVASEGSTVTAAASAGSTATSGRCRRPPRASGGGGGGQVVVVVRRRRGGRKRSCSGFPDRKLGRPRRTKSAPPSATTPGRARRYAGC